MVERTETGVPRASANNPSGSGSSADISKALAKYTTSTESLLKSIVSVVNDNTNAVMRLIDKFQVFGSVRSEGNSTNVPLAYNGTWTGASELVAQNDVLVSGYTDVPGTLYMEFSVDGTNWDSSLVFKVKSSFNEIHKLIKGARWYRTRFVNDNVAGSDQTYLRLTTSYGNYGILTSPLNGIVTQDADAIITRPYPYENTLIRGLIKDNVAQDKFGEALGVTSGDIWSATGTYTGQPTGATQQTVQIISANAADTVAGTGMRTVRFFGLKTPTSTAYEYEDVNTNGGTVTTSTTWWRINTAYGISYGSGGTNAGTITIRHSSTTANVFAVIATGYGRTKITAYTVPYGCIALLLVGEVRQVRSGGSSATARVSLRTREDGVGGYNATRSDLTISGGSKASFVGKYPIQFPALTDIKVSVDSATAASDFSAYLEFEVINVQ